MSTLQQPERDRLFIRCVAAITGVGAVWRLAMLISKWHVPLHYGDAWYYSIQAINNAHGRWFREASGPFQNWGVLPGAEHPPLTSIVVTPASLLSQPQFWQRATMTLLGILLLPLIALLGRRIGGRVVGVIAISIAAVYPNIWMSDSLVMSETLLLVLVVVALIAALRYRDRFDVRSAVALGLVIGIAGHARSELLMYSPLLAFIGVRSKPRRTWLKHGAIVVGVTIASVLPWIIYNTSRFDSLVLMSTNEGNTWLGANCPLTYSGSGLGGWSLSCLDDGAPPADENTAQRSVRRRHEAVTFIGAHKTRVPIVVATRFLRGADLFGLNENVRADVGEERARWAVWAGMVSWWMLAPLAVIGLWRTRRGVREILLVPVVGVAVVTIVFYGSHRLRVPLEPIVVIGAASFLASLPSVRRIVDRFVTT
jgi:4-amino-4-deoxy-L-arabinose transferase-like glycosyltransferase